MYNGWGLAERLIDPDQRLHKQDFIELIERARRSKLPSHKSQLPLGREGDGVDGDAEVVESKDPIEVD